MLKLISTLLGAIVIVGAAIGFFMESLAWVIQFFQSHWNYLIWGLPVIALAVAYLETFKNGKRFGNTALIFEEIRNPRHHVHWFLAPWIYLTTLLFHFFGASVGRESTAIQMGASLTESWGRLLKVPLNDRPLIIRIGLAAGFGATFGTPLAGAVFAVESPWLFRKRDWLHFPLYLAASFGAQRWSTYLFGSGNSIWRQLHVDSLEITWLSYSFIGLFLVCLCLAYEFLFQSCSLRLRKWPWWVMPATGGILVVSLTFLYADLRFNNLGTPLILQSFSQGASLTDSIGKLGFTFISIISGMKGGEATPMMAAGALFGSWLATVASGLGVQVGAALGLVCLYSLRLQIPVTATFMLLEIFDWKIALLGLPIVSLNELGRRRIHKKLF